jgi:hypothetical protein
VIYELLCSYSNHVLVRMLLTPDFAKTTRSVMAVGSRLTAFASAVPAMANQTVVAASNVDATFAVAPFVKNAASMPNVAAQVSNL